MEITMPYRSDVASWKDKSECYSKEVSENLESLSKNCTHRKVLERVL